MPQKPSALNASPAPILGVSSIEDMAARLAAGDLAGLASVPDYFLDYLVAMEEGFEVRAWPEVGDKYWRLYLDEVPVAYIGQFDVRNLVRVQGVEHYSPSRNPVYSSEIITRERIGTRFDVLARHWVASECALLQGPPPITSTGPTPSIAALRCYIATRVQRKTGQNSKNKSAAYT